MATSGSFNTSSVGNFYFTFSWSRTEYSSEKNEHYIKYSVVAHNTAGNYRTVYLKKLVINNSTVFSHSGTSGNGKAYYDGDTVTSGTMTIASSNSSGDGNISASFEAGVGVYPSSNCSGSDSWALTRIPRYATSVQSLKSKTETSITMNWSSDSTIDYIWYSKDNGSNWTGINVTDGKSGSYTISSLSANTTYKIKTRVRRKDSQLTTDSSVTSVTTYDYPYCTDSPNFVIGNAVTLKFYNPLGREFKFYIIANGTQLSGEWTISGTSYSGINSTETTVPQLYSSIPNDSSGKYQVKVVYGNSTKTRNNGNTYSIDKSKCMPIFNSFTYKDEGKSENGKEYSTRLTGNPQIIINNYNDFKVVIKPEDKAVAPEQFYATIKKYRAVCGNLADEQPYSPDSEVILNLGCIKDRTVTVYAIDSREVSTPVSIAISNDNWKEYTDILIQSALIERTDGVGTTATLKFQGTIWNNTFGTQANEIVSCQYKYKKSNESEYSDLIDITPSKEEDMFTFNSTIKGDLEANGFNASNSFNIQIIVTDKISSVTYNVLLGAGTPAMAIHPDGVSFGGPYNENIGGALQTFGLATLGQLEIEKLKIISDCNDTSLKTGFYYCQGDTVNTPHASAWFLQVMKRSDSVITQVAYRYVNNEVWVRNYNTAGETGWKDWEPISQDSGWQTPALTSDFMVYGNNASNTPRYRKKGKTVEIQGAITPKTDLTANTTYTIFTLPEGYRPSRSVTRLCQGTTTRIWLLTIEANGNVTLSRYREGTNWTPPYSSNWFPFNEIFLID